jgi:hypothetical protein
MTTSTWFLKTRVVMDELGVAIAIGMCLAIFEPQQLEPHAFATKLFVDIGQVRHRPGDVGRRCRREQHPFEIAVGELVRQRPRQPGCVGAADVITDGGEREIE